MLPPKKEPEKWCGYIQIRTWIWEAQERYPVCLAALCSSSRMKRMLQSRRKQWPEVSNPSQLKPSLRHSLCQYTEIVSWVRKPRIVISVWGWSLISITRQTAKANTVQTPGNSDPEREFGSGFRQTKFIPKKVKMKEKISCLKCFMLGWRFLLEPDSPAHMTSFDQIKLSLI
jgi:hypothetical protein